MNEEFWSTVCGHIGRLRPLYIVLVVLLLLTIFSLVFMPGGDSASAASVVAKINLGLLAVALGLTAYLEIRCRQFREQRADWRS